MKLYNLEDGNMNFNILPILIRQIEAPTNDVSDVPRGSFKTWILVFVIFLTVIFSSRLLLIFFFAVARKLFGRQSANRSPVLQDPPLNDQNHSQQSNSHFLPTSPTTPPVVMLQSMMPPTRIRPPVYGIQSYSSHRSIREHDRTNLSANLEDLNSFIVENEKKDESCPVCLEPIGNQPVSTGQCLHLCHTSCMKSWLAKDRTVSCPVCRVTLHDAIAIDDTIQPKGEKRRNILTEVAVASSS